VSVVLGVRTDLRVCAAQLRREADGLQRRIVDGANDAVSPLARVIAVNTPAYLPIGYATVMAKSIRVQTSTSLVTNPGVRARVFAVGRREGRDVTRIDAGILRHPLYGNRLHWYAQKVTRGFVKKPFGRLRPGIVSNLNGVLEDVRARIERG